MILTLKYVRFIFMVYILILNQNFLASVYPWFLLRLYKSLVLNIDIG